MLRFLRPEIDINAGRNVEGINIDRGSQQKLNTENLRPYMEMKLL